MIRTSFVLLLLCASLAAIAVLASEANARELLSPSLSTASAGSIPAAELQALLEGAVAQGVPGAVMGVATPEGAWFGTAGVGDTVTQGPMSALHAIRLASITKTFTASLVWSLIEEKRLGLNQRVNRWISPGLVPKGDVITVGMLLNHTSGLYDHENSPEFMKKMQSDPTREWTAEEVLAITRAHPMNFTPGTHFAYCNTGYYILGMIAEAASGQKVEDLVRKRFFTRHGMARTSLTKSGKLPSLRTPGYLWLDGYGSPLSVLRWNFSWDWTAGSGVSTAYDMLAWAAALTGGTVLRPETLDMAWTIKAPSIMGYGFEVTKNGLGYRRIGHTGLNPGTTTDFLFYPDKGWALFSGLNTSDYRTVPQINTARILLDIRNGAEAALGWNVDYRPAIKQVTKLIKQQMQDDNVVGLGIALVDGQNVVWQEGFGYADKANKIAATADTVFQIGSISKPFTGTAIMQLVEKGKIDIDKPVTDYLPEFTIRSRLPGVDASSVTPRALMANHAGLPYNSPDMMGYSFRPEAMQQALKILKKDWMCFPPFTTYAYSNFGAALSGLLVERVSGQDFITYTDNHIFAPLAMSRSSFAPKPEMTPYVSKSYSSDGKLMKRVFVNYLPAGSTLSSAAEMTHFMRAMLAGGSLGGNTVLKPATLRKMWTAQNEGVPLDFDYRVGLYWILSDPELEYAGKIVSFSGDTAQQHSRLILVPEHQLGVVVLTNSANGGGIARTAAVAAIEGALTAKKGIEPPPVPSPLPPAPMPLRKLQRCVGLYTGMGGGVVSVSVEDDHLLVQAFSGFSYKLLPLVDGNFAVDGYPGMETHELSFEPVAGYEVFDDIWLGVKLLPFLTKVTPAAPGKVWLGRCGSYVAEMTSDFYPFWKTLELTEHDGVLTMIVNGGIYYALSPVTDTKAVNVGLGTYYGDTVRIEKSDGVEKLIFQNYTFRKSS